MSAKSESCPLCGWPSGKEYNPKDDQKEMQQPIPPQEPFEQNFNPVNNTGGQTNSSTNSLFGYASLSAFFSIITFMAFSPYRAGKGLIFVFFLMFIISLALSIITIVGAVTKLSKMKSGKGKNVGKCSKSKDMMEILFDFMDLNISSLVLSVISIILLIIKLIVFIAH